MRWGVLAVGILAASAAMAQAAANASISGVVRDKSGNPLPNYMVMTPVNATFGGEVIHHTAETRDVTAVTDEHGRYRLGDLPPGEYRIAVRPAQGFGSMATPYRSVTLAGRDLEGIDFSVAVDGTITGKVVDENGEPLPNITVFLVAREYYLGGLGYYLKSVATTDDRGSYTLERAAAGRAYYVLAEKRDRNLPAHSEAPLNPKLRRPVPMRTWYPNSPQKEGAAPLVLRSGERREGVNIEMRNAQSYCIDGTLGAGGGPAALRFDIEAQQPSSGTSNGMGLYMATPGGTTGPDGKFRICDLYPGTYRLMASEAHIPPKAQQAPAFAVVPVTITDRDISGLRVVISSGSPLEGEVAWDGAAPEKPVDTKISISLWPLSRSHFSGENDSARCDIPSTFEMPAVLVDDYAVWPQVNAPGLYVKDVTYVGRSVLYEPVHVGSAIGNGGLRVIIGHDGAKLAARVADKDGNPVGDTNVLVMPADATSEARLAAGIVIGRTDQTGRFTSITLEPGKYYVAATPETIDYTPETIGRLWQSRDKFKQVDLAPNGTGQVTLEPVTLE